MEFTWASYRCTCACAKAFAHSIARAKIKAEILAEQPRLGGRFSKSAPKPPLERTPAERAEKREEIIQSKFDKYVAETRDQTQALATQHALALGNLKFQLETKTKEVLSLRGKLRIALRIAAPTATAKRAPTGLQGGEMAKTKRKLAAKIDFWKRAFSLLPPVNKLCSSTFKGTSPFSLPLPPQVLHLLHLKRSARNTQIGYTPSAEKWSQLLMSLGL
jgi:hypothetical protein